MTSSVAGRSDEMGQRRLSLGRCVTQARLDARHVELGRSQQRAQLVVQIARQAAALVFACGLQMKGQLGELRGTLPDLGFQAAALDLGDALELQRVTAEDGVVPEDEIQRQQAAEAEHDRLDPTQRQRLELLGAARGENLRLTVHQRSPDAAHNGHLVLALRAQNQGQRGIDHAMVRAGLRQFFADQAGFAVVAEAANGREALDIVRRGEVDVVIMDIGMPGQSGVDALAAIRARAPELPVLILSGFAEEHYATTLLRQGASGYLNKDCDPEEIVKAIRTVFRGRKYITAGVAERLADGLAGGGDRPLHEQLSERELQVFLRLARRETVGHMAESRSLSLKTVSTYRTRVMEKMQLGSNSDLTYYASKNGLIQ